jgi:Leucine-rich repeat (LRR) protein
MKNIYAFLFIIVFSFVMKAEVSVSEKSALLKLYNATNGANWTSKWDLNTPVSSWYGVGLQDDKVVSLQLPNNNLVGVLPSEISDLVYLKNLNLYKNSISGMIPASIGKMKSLESLNLSFNKLSGALPSAIGDASSLKNLELFMNGFSGNIPSEIGKLANCSFVRFFTKDNLNHDIYNLYF